MSQPTKSQRLLRAARAGEPVARVEIPRTTCPQCTTGQWALPSGEPRPHLRPAVQGDPAYREDIPVRVECS